MELKSYRLMQTIGNESCVEVDDLIAPTIQLLNLKNYITSACCSGHAERDPDCAYIQYDFGEMTPEVLPDGWFWDGDGQMYYEYTSLTREEREKEIRDTMRRLYYWAQSLPDAH